MRTLRQLASLFVALALITTLSACATQRSEPDTSRTTARDKTKKGAAIGAASGAVLGALLGEGELDEVLAGAAIGAGIGAGVGVYMDRQEERFGKIPGTSVERVGENTLLVHFESDVLFDVDSAVLGASARDSLDQAAAVLMDFPKTGVLTQGHTDASGSETHNEELSERRARSVANYLVGRGIDASRITAIGYGEGYPIADNDTDDGRRANRRVDLLLRAKAK